jgi:hypothetical protein
VLVELGLVEQRYRAVLEVLNDGATGGGRGTPVRGCPAIGACVAAALCRGGPGWADRPELQAGLVSTPDRPAGGGADCGVAVGASGWGPRSILTQLGREEVAPQPGRSSVYRALVRHGLIQPRGLWLTAQRSARRPTPQ